MATFKAIVKARRKDGFYPVYTCREKERHSKVWDNKCYRLSESG